MSSHTEDGISTLPYISHEANNSISSAVKKADDKNYGLTKDNKITLDSVFDQRTIRVIQKMHNRASVYDKCLEEMGDTHKRSSRVPAIREQTEGDPLPYGKEERCRIRTCKRIEPKETRSSRTQFRCGVGLRSISGVIATGKEANVYSAVLCGYHFSETKMFHKKNYDRGPSEADIRATKCKVIGSRNEPDFMNGVRILGIQGEGEESQEPVDRCEANDSSVKDGDHVAVKIYKTMILGFRNRDRYVQGDYRFRGGYSKNPRNMVCMWAEKEARNLKRLARGGIRCPKVIWLEENVLVMELLGRKNTRVVSPRDIQGEFDFDESHTYNDGFYCENNKIDMTPGLSTHPIIIIPFPRLSDVKEFCNSYAVYLDACILLRKLFWNARLVHGDFSEYNILVDPKTEFLYVIDVSQAVDHDHPNSLYFLRRDCVNITKFFAKRMNGTTPVFVDYGPTNKMNTVHDPQCESTLTDDPSFIHSFILPCRYLYEYVINVSQICPSELLDSMIRDVMIDPVDEIEDSVFLQKTLISNLCQINDLEILEEEVFKPHNIKLSKFLKSEEEGLDNTSNSSFDDDESPRNILPVLNNDHEYPSSEVNDNESNEGVASSTKDSMTKGEWKLMVKEERREARKTKCPKHLKKRYKKKAANR